jgi:hypothetical protein
MGIQPHLVLGLALGPNQLERHTGHSAECEVRSAFVSSRIGIDRNAGALDPAVVPLRYPEKFRVTCAGRFEVSDDDTKVVGKHLGLGSSRASSWS